MYRSQVFLDRRRKNKTKQFQRIFHPFAADSEKAISSTSAEFESSRVSFDHLAGGSEFGGPRVGNGEDHGTVWNE